MNQLFGGAHDLGWVAIKALLLYLTAVIGFRLGERRTLAEMSAFDFVAAVAVGAIIGRVPNSNSTSYIAGAITLVTVLIAHRIISGFGNFQGLQPCLTTRRACSCRMGGCSTRNYDGLVSRKMTCTGSCGSTASWI